MDEKTKYGWLAGVAFIGGIIGYFRKQWQRDKGKSKSAKLRSAMLSVLTSMFVAYITYEVLVHFTETVNISVALAGLASFAGTDLLVAYEEGFIATAGEVIKRIFGGKQ